MTEQEKIQEPADNKTDIGSSAPEIGGEQTLSDADEINSAPAENGTEAEQLSELQAFRDQALRQMADLKNELENTQKRTRKELENAQRFASGVVIGALLPTVDSLDKTLESIGSGSEPVALQQGIVLTRKNLLDVFSEHGVTQIEVKPGDVFNPHLHEAMTQIPTAEYKPGSVMAVLQTGYLLHERTLRPARVVLALARDAADNDKPQGDKGENESAGDEATANGTKSENST